MIHDQTVQEQHLNSDESELGDLNPAHFQWLDDQARRWTMQYLDKSNGYALSPRILPGDIARLFPSEPPATPMAIEKIWEQFERDIVPHCMGWNIGSGNYVGYFGLGSSFPAIVAQKLESVLNQTRMLWSTSPVATELESVVLSWIKQLLDLPKDWFGMLHTNSRVDLALVAALEARGINVSASGLTGKPRFRVYASVEAHGSVEKAMVMTGLGKDNLRRVGVDERYCMDAKALRGAIQKDIQAGYVPLMAVSTIGTTSTTSIDPTREIAAICRHYGLWLHCDAAYAGLFAIDHQMRWLLDGCEMADSFTTNPHKPLFLPFDHSIFFIKDPSLLKHALQSNAAYLAHGSTPGTVDLGDLSDKIPHRFPALSLWMVLCCFGVNGIIARHRKQRELAQLVTERVQADPEMELMAPTHLTVTCFRAHPHGWSEPELNALNKRLMETINERGRYFFSDTILGGRVALRIAIGNIKTDVQAVDGLWQEIATTLEALKILRGLPLFH